MVGNDGLELGNQTSQDTQVSPAEKLALFQKIVKTQTKADSQARWKI